MTKSEKPENAALAANKETLANSGDIDVQATLIDQTEFRLPPEQWQAFCELLDAPPRDIPALRRLFAEKSPWE